MIILADIGNTNTIWGIANSRDDVRSVLSTRTGSSRASIGKTLLQICEHGKPEGMAVASVVPDAGSAVTACAKTLMDEAGIFAPGYEEFKHLMTVKVKPVIEPGADRLANAFALKELHELPACAVDVGTAITIDVVDGRGQFLGGAIAPGEELQLAALRQYTAQLGKVRSLPKSVPGIGNTTATAMAVGIRRGVPWAVMGMISGVEEALGRPLETIVTTGGGGTQMCLFLERALTNVVNDEILTLRGLACAWYARAG